MIGLLLLMVGIWNRFFCCNNKFTPITHTDFQIYCTFEWNSDSYCNNYFLGGGLFIKY